MTELESSQPVREAARAIDGRAGTWPLLLPALRRAAPPHDVRTLRNVSRVSSDSRAHTSGSVSTSTTMEYGTADALRVSRQVLVALARVLGTTAADLERAGRVPTLGGPTTGLAPTRRGLPDAPPFSEVPSGYRQPDARQPAEWAALDRLFLGEDEMTSAGRRAERAEALAQQRAGGGPAVDLGRGVAPSTDRVHRREITTACSSRTRHLAGRVRDRGDAHVSGVLLRASGRILVDALEAARAPGRKRFTIAHELGHLVLHDDDVGPRARTAGSTERELGAERVAHRTRPHLAYPPGELEANQFAAAMLMPAPHLPQPGSSARTNWRSCAGIRGRGREAARVPGLAPLTPIR